MNGEKINLQDMSESLNGFDEIAIRQRFRMGISDMQNDAFTYMRALWFVHVRRTDGLKDPEAYNAAMDLSIKELGERFDLSGSVADAEEPSVVKERDELFANFVVGTGLSYTFTEYMTLTVQQREAIIEQVKEFNKQG